MEHLLKTLRVCWATFKIRTFGTYRYSTYYTAFLGEEEELVDVAIYLYKDKAYIIPSYIQIRET